MICNLDGDIIPTHLTGGGYPCNKNGDYVHRVVAELALGKSLPDGVEVHHVDSDKANFSASNLVICQDASYHQLLHSRTRIINLGGNPDTHKWCNYHNRLESRSEFSTRPSSFDGLHNHCRTGTNQYRKDRGLNRNKFDWRGRLGQQYRRAIKSGKEFTLL